MDQNVNVDSEIMSLAGVGNALVVTWKKKPTMSGVEALHKALAAMDERNPNGYGMLVIMGPDSSPPDKDVGDRMSKDVSFSAGHKFVAVYGSILIAGLKGSVLRLALNTMVFISGRAKQMKVAPTPREAVTLLLEDMRKSGCLPSMSVDAILKAIAVPRELVA